MKVIDGKGATLGRLASYVAKEALKGEEVRVVNCEDIIITGNKKDIIAGFEEKRRKVGSTQKGPKLSRDVEKVVKRTIRGMLPEHREGMGKLAFRRIKCYKGLPSEFENSKIEKMEKRKETKSHKISEVIR